MTTGEEPTNRHQEDGRSDHDDREAGLAAARQGDERGFEFLYDSLFSSLLAFASRRGAEDPEELANAALFSAFQHLPTFTGGYDAFRSYVYRIMRNRLIDDYRRRGRRPSTVPLEGHHTAAPDGNFDDLVADRDHAQQLLSTLTEDQRDVLLLRVAADLSLAETAETMGKPVSAIKALQRRAVRALHRNLGEEAHS